MLDECEAGGRPTKEQWNNSGQQHQAAANTPGLEGPKLRRELPSEGCFHRFWSHGDVAALGDASKAEREGEEYLSFPFPWHPLSSLVPSLSEHKQTIIFAHLLKNVLQGVSKSFE